MRRARAAACRRCALDAVSRLLRAAEQDRRAGRAAGERAAGDGEPDPARGRTAPSRGRWSSASAPTPPPTGPSSTPPTTPSARRRCPTSCRTSSPTRASSSRPSAGRSRSAEDLEADDLLGTYARLEAEAGGRALLLTGDRDMYQCASEDVTVLYVRTGGKGAEEVGPAEVRERYGIDPELVPDFIALRGDPSDGLPGRQGRRAEDGGGAAAEPRLAGGDPRQRDPRAAPGAARGADRGPRGAARLQGHRDAARRGVERPTTDRPAPRRGRERGMKPRERLAARPPSASAGARARMKKRLARAAMRGRRGSPSRG